jgi:nitrous oxidase accessory protein
MVRRTVLTSIFSIFLVNLLFAATIKVGPGENINSITQALEMASDGDTIAVFGGRYREGEIKVSKRVIMIGHDLPVIDGEGETQVLHITADSVHISGFRVVGSGISHTRDNAAIRFDRAAWGRVTDNELDSNFFGIYLARAHHTVVTGNRIKSHIQRESMSANGIHLWDTRHVTIEDNKITGHRDGIYFEYVKNSVINRNHAEKNLRYGLHFMFSDSCVYEGNSFINNGAGVAVMYTRRVIMRNNLFLDNWGSSSYALLLKDINDSYIVGNIFRNNTIGIRADGSNRSEVTGNLFEDNGWAIRVLSNSMDNHFTQNNFINNTFDVSTNSRQNYSIFDKNYWSKYSGYDLKGDDLGDVPYRPVRLFSLIIEQNPIALILLRSFFIEILDMAERVIPILTPETLVDENPLMRPVNIDHFRDSFRREDVITGTEELKE